MDLKVLIHPHANERIIERGAKIEEVMATEIIYEIQL